LRSALEKNRVAPLSAVPHFEYTNRKSPIAEAMTMDMNVSTLELALGVSACIRQQLESCQGSAIVIPRDIAKLALAFTEAAIESLQAQTRELARSLN
jgi:hypothetical protein